MMPARFICALLLAVGLSLVAAAAAVLYADFRAREGAWADLEYRTIAPLPEERATILDAWRNESRPLIILGAGAPGVGLAVFGAVGLFLTTRPARTKAP